MVYVIYSYLITFFILLLLGIVTVIEFFKAHKVINRSAEKNI